MSNTVINTNVMALNSSRAGRVVSGQQQKASARLSSGMKINSAADDAAGLAISETMRAQIRGLDMASKNAQDAISFIQVAEGGLSEIDNMLQRIRELTVQASNETNTTDDLAAIGKEVSSLVTEIEDMSERVEFNTKKMIGSGSSTFHMQIGANSGQSIGVVTTKMGSAALSLSNAVDTVKSGFSTASAYLSELDGAVKTMSLERAKYGAYQNRLEYTIKSLEVSSENTSAAESRIRDADMAKEMMNLTRTNVLQQAANSMLAQANQAPNNVLQLLR